MQQGSLHIPHTPVNLLCLLITYFSINNTNFHLKQFTTIYQKLRSKMTHTFAWLSLVSSLSKFKANRIEESGKTSWWKKCYKRYFYHKFLDRGTTNRQIFMLTYQFTLPSLFLNGNSIGNTFMLVIKKERIINSYRETRKK